jgi:hypothetical protein
LENGAFSGPFGFRAPFGRLLIARARASVQ